MTSLSIPGMPPAGNPSVPRLALHGPGLSSGGLRLRCGGRAGRAARAASTPSRPWAAPCLSHRVPHDVLTPSSPLLTEPNRRTRYEIARGQVGILCPIPGPDHGVGHHDHSWRPKPNKSATRGPGRTPECLRCRRLSSGLLWDDPLVMWACNVLRTKYFHGVSSRNQPHTC
jgi:hypothetical protein